MFKKIPRDLRFQIRKNLQGARVILFERYPNLIEQPRFMTPQPMLIASKQFKLLSLSRVGLKRSQVSVIGPEKLRQDMSVKGVALGWTDAKSVSGPIQRLGVDRIDYHHRDPTESLQCDPAASR
jgi:hypothetical protein